MAAPNSADGLLLLLFFQFVLFCVVAFVVKPDQSMSSFNNGGNASFLDLKLLLTLVKKTKQRGNSVPAMLTTCKVEF